MPVFDHIDRLQVDACEPFFVAPDARHVVLETPDNLGPELPWLTDAQLHAAAEKDAGSDWDIDRELALLVP